MFKVDSLGYSFLANEILKNISFEISQGEFLSIVGPNGSGKTTLLRCLLGHYHFSGKVEFDRRDIRSYSRKEIARMVSYIPQIVPDIPGYTVDEFIELAKYSQVGGKSAREALSYLGMESFSKRLMSSLSGGERQKVLLAAAISQESRIIILDEPTSFQDPKHDADIYRTLKKLNSDFDKTICVVTHDINRAVGSSDRIVALKEGRVCFDKVPHEFFKESTLEFLYETKFSFLKDGNRVFALPEVDCE